jgi:hypothetical protein
MGRKVLQTMFVVGVLGSVAEAQQPVVFVGAGSTWQGDYLRGVGIAAYGMGVYNEKTAIANQINANTFIMMNEYFAAVAKQGAWENAERRRQELRKINDLRKQIYERLHDNPELRDVFTGDALNVTLSDLTDPKIDDSTSRFAQVPLDPGIIRQIPFKLGERNESFSMNRLSMRRKKWPVFFQDDTYKPARDAYQRAVDHGLDLAIDGKMEEEALRAVEQAIDGLENALMSAPIVHEVRNQKLYSDAKAKLDILKRTEGLFMDSKVQRAFAEIDNYSGTTVDELRLFMQKHGLTFANADTPDEKVLFPKLYMALKLHREKVLSPDIPGK